MPFLAEEPGSVHEDTPGSPGNSRLCAKWEEFEDFHSPVSLDEVSKVVQSSSVDPLEVFHEHVVHVLLGHVRDTEKGLLKQIINIA